MASLLSNLTVATVGLASKAFLNIPGLAHISVNGLPTLLHALQSQNRNDGQGILTVANHISTLDDPVTWGILPSRYFLSSRTTRWALGASDIMFTNPVFSEFFRQGQVLETFRGKGIYQPAVDTAIHKLNQGAWVHLFGEGKVNQPDTYPRVDGMAHMPRFKWGVGRILMEANVPPVVIPMWLTGFDKLMPEGRPFPYKYLPRLGVHLSVTIGDPLPEDEIKNALGLLGANQNNGMPSHNLKDSIPAEEHMSGWIGEEVARGLHQQLGYNDEEAREKKDREMRTIRSEVTAVIQRRVGALGRAVSGDLLGGNTARPRT